MSSHIYVRMYGVYVFKLCICPSWENIFSLATGWTWGHGAAAPLTSLGLLDLADEIISSVWCQCFGFFWVGIYLSVLVSCPSGL